MKRKKIVHKSYSWSEAENWNIEQQIRMSVEERRLAVKELRRRVFGENIPDIRKSHKIK